MVVHWSASGGDSTAYLWLMAGLCGVGKLLGGS